MEHVALLLCSAVALAALLELAAARREGPWRSGRADPARPRMRRGAILGLLSVTVALVAQAAAGTTTWQLVPALFGAALVLLLATVRLLRRWMPLRRTGAVLSLVGAAISAASLWALPIAILDAPTGPHAVGTTTIVLRDDGRPETYGPTPGAAREVVLQVWYPAAPEAARDPGPLIAEAAAFVPLGAPQLGLPRFALGHLGAVPGHATRDVAALDAPSPVVVLSHGWTGSRILQADLAEELASRGFVVAALDHTFGALVTTFPDGRAIPFDPAALPEFGTIDDDEYSVRSRRLLATFRDDQRLAVRALETAPPEMLAGRMDLSRLAFVGHSTGGGAAVMSCAAEPRCRAVVGFDPWVAPTDPQVLDVGPGAPMLTLRTESWRDVPNERVLAALHDTQRARGVREVLVGLDGALHRDFTLIGALSPLAAPLGLEGATPGALTRRAMLVWTERFLEHHLRDGVDPISTPPTDLPYSRVERSTP